MTDIVSELRNADSPLSLTHKQADKDSFGAAISLQTLLGRGKVCTPDGTEKSARSLLQATETNPLTSHNIDSFDTVVVLDAPSFERISPITPEAPILVDHHEPDNLSEIASAALVDQEADATSFLVAQLAVGNDWQLSPDAALPLLVGIFGDTGNLTTATAETVRLSGTLLSKLEHHAEEFSEQISRTPDSSRRNARTLGTL